MFLDLRESALSGAQRMVRSAAPGGEAADLLNRYPDITETDLARLINAYRRLPALDFALMMSDARLAPKLDRLFNEQRSKLRAPLREYATLLAVGLFGIAVIAVAMFIRS